MLVPCRTVFSTCFSETINIRDGANFSNLFIEVRLGNYLLEKADQQRKGFYVMKWLMMTGPGEAQL